MKKRILFITQRYPYPIISGDRLRAYNILKILSKHFNVDLLILENYGNKDSKILLPFVDRVIYLSYSIFRVWSFLWGLVRGLPMQTAFCTYPNVRKYVRNHASEYDLLFCHLARTSEYGYGIMIKKILDYSDAYSFLYTPHQRPKGFWGWFGRFEYPRMRLYEKKIGKLFDSCLVTTDHDAQWLIEECGVSSDKLTVIPNGVSHELLSIDRLEAPTPTLTFLGNMHYYPNVECILNFTKNIFPLIQRYVPDVHLIIMGVHPIRKIRALSSKNVTVTGYVPNISKYLKTTTIGIAPLYISSGIQNKILEMMASGVPVVTTPQVTGSFDDLFSMNCIVSEINEPFAGSVIELLGSLEKRKKIGENGRVYVQEKYLWSHIEKSLIRVFQNVLYKNSGN